MSAKILFNKYGEPYPQNQEINAKLDNILYSIGDLKKDVAVLKKDVENNKTSIAEIKTDINSARWQVMVLVIGVVTTFAVIFSAFK